MEARGELTVEGYLEIAWMMGCIKYFNGHVKDSSLYERGGPPGVQEEEEEGKGKGEGGRKSSSGVPLACTDPLFFSDSRPRRHEEDPNASSNS